MLESDHSHDKYIPSFPLIDKNNSCSKYRWIDSFIAINFADNSTNYFLPGPPLSNCWLNLNKKQSVIKVQLCYWQSMATNWALGIFKSKLMYLLTALFSCLIRTKSQRFKDFEVNRELINWFLTHTLWVRTLRHSPLRLLHLIIHTSHISAKRIWIVRFSILLVSLMKTSLSSFDLCFSNLKCIWLCRKW